MAFEFKFPDVGEGIHEGTLVKWLVKMGDDVSVDQHIAEVETDKAIVTMPSPKKGKIAKLLFKEGEVIKVGEVFVVIDAQGESSAPTAPQKAPVAPPIAPLAKPTPKPEAKAGEHYTGSVVGFVQEASEVSPIYGQHASSTQQASSKVEATLAVRKLAKDKGVDLSKVIGTGSGARITEEDVNKAAQGGASPSSAQSPASSFAAGSKHVRKYDFYGYLDRQPLKGVRKKVAEHMSQSLANAPQLTHFHWADVSKLEERREQLKKEGKSITALSYIIRAISLALIKHPMVNSMIEEDEIMMKKYYNIGIAVDTQDGLMVPVLKRANTKTVEQIAIEIKKLSTDARDRKINLMDMKGGTFTISNLGMMGVEHFTPILNYPEAGLLGVGKTKDDIRIENGQLKVHQMLPLSFTYDHRVISGADAARFMVDVIALLENHAEIEKAPVLPSH